MGRPEVRVVVLFEDRAQECFLRRLVERLGLRPVRYENCANAVGVLRRLGVEVDALRSRKHQKNLGLVVMIDADEKGLQGRETELLARIAADAADGKRTPTERVALLVPAREIENWYVHLCSPPARPIDETRDYKRSPEWRDLEKDLGGAASRAVAAWPSAPSPIDPLSVLAALEELKRVG